MIAARFRYDGEPLLRLNEVQLQMKLQIEQKIGGGRYHFESVPCAVCANQDGNFEMIADKDRYGLRMTVVICRDCGLIQTNPRMNQDAYNEFYDIEYRPLYGGDKEDMATFFRKQYDRGREIFHYLDSHGGLGKRDGMYVLEIGCGAGGIIGYFRDRGCRVRGVDLGSAYVAYGKREHGLDLTVGNIDSLRDCQDFDLIIYSHVFEHVLAPNAELRKIVGLMAEDGLLYIEVPGVKNIHNAYEGDLLRYLQNAHVYHYSLASLSNVALRNEIEMVAGSEAVQCIFRRKRQDNGCAAVTSDYLPSLRFLRCTERLRALAAVVPRRFSHCRKAVVSRVGKVLCWASERKV